MGLVAGSASFQYGTCDTNNLYNFEFAPIDDCSTYTNPDNAAWVFNTCYQTAKYGKASSIYYCMNVGDFLAALNLTVDGTIAPPATTTGAPTSTPTNTPTNAPTSTPTNTPTNAPTSTPTDAPTSTPTSTSFPTSTPTSTPTSIPTNTPSNTPTTVPTTIPTNSPSTTSTSPTSPPTTSPSTATPTSAPSSSPTSVPPSAPEVPDQGSATSSTSLLFVTPILFVISFILLC
eukprot:Phypoly_transcript_15736.p1 GENE.Phypoly_transcript_15736~~Phypoly_transcript_15736.p1  ORF type:complete len:267 (+),score=65.66 Phypoly_transcript_15736:109-801(+)